MSGLNGFGFIVVVGLTLLGSAIALAVLATLLWWVVGAP